MDDLELTALAPPIVERRKIGLAYGDPTAWALLFEPAPGRSGFAQIIVQDRREQRFFARVRELLRRAGVTPARYRVRPPIEPDLA